MATPRYYAVTRLNDCFECEIIDGFDTEEDADNAAEKYSERFPNAVIDYHPVY
jgi:hypothetical protein